MYIYRWRTDKSSFTLLSLSLSLSLYLSFSRTHARTHTHTHTHTHNTYRWRTRKNWCTWRLPWSSSTCAWWPLTLTATLTFYRRHNIFLCIYFDFCREMNEYTHVWRYQQRDYGLAVGLQYLCVCVCVCVCREREREREIPDVYIYIYICVYGDSYSEITDLQ